MKVFIISDEDYNTDIYKKMSASVMNFFQKKNFEVIQQSIKKDDLHVCLGCYGCWTKTPGECVINDAMAQINRTFNESDVVVYLSPIVFGQFSPNIKNVIDRGLSNVLPLFVKKSDGTTGHPPRYESKPKVIAIGYGDNISNEQAELFVNVVKHKAGVEAFVYAEGSNNIVESLETVKLGRMVG
jgi:multimeric flavodoxin WrbA